MRCLLLGICVAALFAPPLLAKTYPESEWKARFPHRPFPEYPAAYRVRHMEGSGLFRMHIDEQGRVTAVSILKSTGHRYLDDLAMKTLSQWQGRPGPKWELDMPITFTLNMNVHPRNPEDEKAYRGRY